MTDKISNVIVRFPVTTFLKVACGARENPGGSGTFSEATPQTLLGRIPTAHRHENKWDGQGNNSSIGAMIGTTWPKQYFG